MGKQRLFSAHSALLSSSLASLMLLIISEMLNLFLIVSIVKIFSYLCSANDKGGLRSVPWAAFLHLLVGEAYFRTPLLLQFLPVRLDVMDDDGNLFRLPFSILADKPDAVYPVLPLFHIS